MRTQAIGSLTILLVSSFAVSCVGTLEAPGTGPAGESPGSTTGPGDTPESTPAEQAARAATTTVRRLSIREYNAVIAALVYDTTKPFVFSGDAHTPFDNDVDLTLNAGQLPGTALIDTAEATANDVVARLMADKKRLTKLVGSIKGCPAAPSATDSACFKQFVTQFGRRALRRPLMDAEIAKHMTVFAYAQTDNDFNAAVGWALRAFLQLPEVIYRVESDTSKPVKGFPGVYQLSGWEMASRLSFLLWGEGPDDDLLDRAQRSELDSIQGVRQAIVAMLGDARARNMISTFNAMWFNYDGLALASPALGRRMNTQTNALIKKVIFDDRKPWQDLLRSDKTYVDYALATHYKLPIPAGSPLKETSAGYAWLPWDKDRQGFFSEGSFLSFAQAQTEEQMVVRRGQYIRERLMCQTLPPKPKNVASTAPPPKQPCKYDVLEAATGAGACHACHQQMNPVGFGLDQYGPLGAPRTNDVVDEFIQAKFHDLKLGDTLSQCPVHTEGVLDGQTFAGPKGLAELLVDSPQVNDCVARQVYRFAVGRSVLDGVDKQILAGMTSQKGPVAFLDVVTDLATSDSFRFRRVENQ